MTELNKSLEAVHVDVQARVDRVKRARVELAASIEDLVLGRETIALQSAAAVKFIDDYLNPVVADPAPISPETVDVALPPEEEIPVFTTVDDEELAFDNTSGGTVDITEEVLVEEFGEFVTADDVLDVADDVLVELPFEEVETEEPGDTFIPGPSGGT